ncbi:MAG: hypothetical protein WBQ17_02140 [Rhizomicrobium sp.]|jgi:hypothetical protein
MKTENAAGRNTDHRGLEDRTEAHVEAQIGALNEHLMRMLEESRGMNANDDPYGHARSAQIDMAMRLSKATAKLVFALSKLKAEFHHNINVSKGPAAAREEPGR